MKNLSKFFILILFFLPLLSYAQSAVTKNLCGVLSCDSKISFDKSIALQVNNLQNINTESKSVWLAAGLSAAIPGAGEFYSHSYIKSAAFFATEVALIVVSVIYTKKGDNQTDFFQNYANQHWSVVRYAKWTIKNANSINGSVDPTQYKIFDANGNVNWNELNRFETDLGSYYSHQLPYFGEQQYYELIGKYPQFNVGWDDFGDENTPFHYEQDRSNLTPRMIYYSHERGKANDLYNVAAKAVVFIVVNHVLSAIDAAWTTNRFNKNLEIHASIEKFNDGFQTTYFPKLNLKYCF